MAFTEEQTHALAKKLSAKNVKTREQHGVLLSYIEGWHALNEANRIFGYDAWDQDTRHLSCVWEGTRRGLEVASYLARVRITVRAGGCVIVRDGCGSGHGTGLD